MGAKNLCSLGPERRSTRIAANAVDGHEGRRKGSCALIIPLSANGQSSSRTAKSVRIRPSVPPNVWVVRGNADLWDR